MCVCVCVCVCVCARARARACVFIHTLKEIFYAIIIRVTYTIIVNYIYFMFILVNNILPSKRKWIQKIQI